jgi:N-acetylgalactosamine-N,N'-diacetylbacillosaminyl-diphospho-undecaprenol 4-alpha-N-acetylgalactosaminyltransferase
MVILEALSSGILLFLLIVKQDQVNVVQNEYNGLLVENQNFEALQEAFERMVDDSQLYYFCKENAKASVNSFSNENSIEKWLKFIES